MALQEKKPSPEIARPVTTKGKNGWETIPMGRVLHWFSQAPSPNRNAVARDHRVARLLQNGRRKVL